MLDELCKHGLIQKFVDLMNLNGRTSLSQPVYLVCCYFNLKPYIYTYAFLFVCFFLAGTSFHSYLYMFYLFAVGFDRVTSEIGFWFHSCNQDTF